VNVGDAEPEAQNGDGSGGPLDAHRELVVEIARSFEDRAETSHIDLGLTLDELIQEGSAGLLLAVERFDPETSITFSSYATWWIHQAIFRGLVQVRDIDGAGSARGSWKRLERFSSTSEFREDAERLLEFLDERERTLLRLRLGLDRGGEPGALGDVADHFGWTRERVRQVEGRTLSKIRHFEMTELGSAADRLTSD